MERTGLNQELEFRNWVFPRTDAVESERSPTLEVIRDKYLHYAGPLTGPFSNLLYIYKSIARLADQVTESANYVNTVNPELAANRETSKQWQTYQRYGDYVGKIFNDLKGGREGPPSLQKLAIAIANEIDLAERRRETSNPPRFDITNLLERQTGLLEVTEGTSVSIGLAKFAVASLC